MTASASGCVELRSKASRMPSSISLSTPLSGVFSQKVLTLGLPRVSVPVLSRTKALTLCPSSRLFASRMRICCSAPLPMPTIRAVGVASPKAQGQAMTNTDTAESNPKESAFSPPKIIQDTKVRMERPKTTGTKMLDTLSTSRCNGALLPWASCTRWMIWASRVVLPIFSAVISKIPF